jgi:hypothetical protein
MKIQLRFHSLSLGFALNERCGNALCLEANFVKNLPIYLLISSAMLANSLFAQELPRPSMAQQDKKVALPTTYNMKAGPVLLNFTGSLESDYEDNIGLTNSGAKSDFLLTPEVGIEAQWPISEVNTLTLSTSLGYTKYMIHPQFDTSHILVAPDSDLSFDIYTGDFKINVHDSFSYQQDPVDEAALSGIVNFNRFENIAGVGVLWDLNKVILNLTYDHIDFVSTGLQTVTGANLNDPGALNFSADQVSLSGELHVSSTLIGGLEASASEREYQDFDGEYTQLSAGPFIKLQITDHIKLEASGGYQYIGSPASNADYSNQYYYNGTTNNGTIEPGTDGGNSENSYYFNVTLDHEVNKYFLQRLSLGHELELGLLAEESDDSYINYSASWHVNSRLNIALTLGYQDISEIGGLVGVSSFDFFSAGVQANFPVTKSISGSLIYQFSDKMAEESDQSYEQNRVGLLLTYHF